MTLDKGELSLQTAHLLLGHTGKRKTGKTVLEITLWPFFTHFKGAQSAVVELRGEDNLKGT